MKRVFLDPKHYTVDVVNRGVWSPTDLSGASALVDPAPQNACNALPRGNDDGEREGLKAYFTRCAVQGSINVPPRWSANGIIFSKTFYTSFSVFVYLVLDTQANNAIPVYDQIWRLPNSANLEPLREKAHLERFQILARKEIRVRVDPHAMCYYEDITQSVTVIHGYQGANVPFDIDIPLDFTTTYLSGVVGSSSIGDICDHALHLYAVAASGTKWDGTDTECSLSYQLRLEYLDH